MAINTFFSNVTSRIRKKSVSLLFLTLLLFAFIIFLWQQIFVTILPGEAGVKWRRFAGGTVVDYVYPEGMHYMYPWDKMYIYNVRVQQTAHEFDVLTVNGMKIHLSISIRYQPEYEVLGLLHQQVGMDYVNKLVIPEIESVLRINIGKIAAQEVYTTKTSLIEKAVSEGIEQVAQRYVKIDDVIIKKVGLPPQVEQSIQYKIRQKHLAEAYEFKLEREKKEAERKTIEAGGIQQYNQLITASLSDNVLLWKGIQATLALAQSQNAKIVVIGSGEHGLPILGSIPMDYEPGTQTHDTKKDGLSFTPTEDTLELSNELSGDYMTDQEREMSKEPESIFETPVSDGTNTSAPADMSASPSFNEKQSPDE